MAFKRHLFLALSTTMHNLDEKKILTGHQKKQLHGLMIKNYFFVDNNFLIQYTQHYTKLWREIQMYQY